MSKEPISSKDRATVRDLSVLERKIDYEFNSTDLLQQALTHKSFAQQNNERLEFIGDAVLGYVIGVMLYRSDSRLGEDVLTLMRANLVRGSALAGVAREIDLAPHLRLGSGAQKDGVRQHDSILADAFEALIGAVHEDGGVVACTNVVERLFQSRLASLDPENLKDPKTQLQELLQGAQMNLPEYRLEEITGADHQRVHTVACEVQQLSIVRSATAPSRRAAEQAAATDMLLALAARGFG